MSKAITPKPRTSHLVGCAHCKAEARILHARQHLSPDMQEQVRKTERAYAALEVEFQQERQAELAAVKRGVRPLPGQWKLDQQRLSTPRRWERESTRRERPDSLPISTSDRLTQHSIPEPPLKVYRDLWHEEAAS